MVLGIIQELDKMKHQNYPLLAKQNWNPYVSLLHRKSSPQGDGCSVDANF